MPNTLSAILACFKLSIWAIQFPLKESKGIQQRLRLSSNGKNLKILNNCADSWAQWVLQTIYSPICRNCCSTYRSTKIDCFQWSELTQSTFLNLKQAISSAPLLKLPNFSLPFVLETDASGIGIRAVLSQNNHPIAYFSRKHVEAISICSGIVCYYRSGGKVQTLLDWSQIHHQNQPRGIKAPLSTNNSNPGTAKVAP